MTSRSLSDVTGRLDATFEVDRFPADSPFSWLVPSVYQDAGIPPADFFEAGFLNRFNGLMLRGSDRVRRIVTAVFPNQEIVDQLVAEGLSETLLVLHHPLFMETSDRGFLPLPRPQLEALRSVGISMYAVHTPLDVHPALSTRHAWARALQLEDLESCCETDSGFMGLIGHLPDQLSFSQLAARVSAISGVKDLNSIEGPSARRVAILPGGHHPSNCLEAQQRGCDAVVVGTYFNQVKNEIGAQYREDLESIRPELRVGLIECSHYASEALVMAEDLRVHCEETYSLETRFIPQEDPWR